MTTQSDFTNRPSAAKMLTNAGIIEDPERIPAALQVYVTQTDRTLKKARATVIAKGMAEEQELQFQRLLTAIAKRVISHPIVKENRYLERFSKGVTLSQARHELQQFSIFAHNFDVAQAMLVTNAPTFESYQKRLQVLLNEKGIPYANGFEGELTGHWKQETVHFQWLLNMAEGLKLSFHEVGKVWLALPGAAQFVDATFRYYAGVDQSVSLGAAFAIENWAANNLWTPWIAGMKKLNASLEKPINLGYLTYHEAEERHHSQSTIDELFDQFSEPWFDAQRFLQGAEGILDEGVLPYYVSQLEHLPEKQNRDWPTSVCAPVRGRRQDHRENEFGCTSVPRPTTDERPKPSYTPPNCVISGHN